MPKFKGEGYDDLVTRMRSDAEGLSERLAVANGIPTIVGEEHYGLFEPSTPSLPIGVWAVHSGTKYGGGELDDFCPTLLSEMNYPYGASDRFSEARRSGLSLNLMFQAAYPVRQKERRELVVNRAGALVLLTHHNHGSFYSQRDRADAQSTHPSWYINESAKDNPKLKRAIYDEWRADIAIAESTYTK